MGTDLFDLRHGKLPCGNNPLRTECMPEIVSRIVRIIRLCADMALDVRTDLLRDLENTRVCNNQRIRTDLF